MASLRFKLAVLKILAKRPECRITLDEIRHEIGTRIVNEGPVYLPNGISALTDIDIFRSEFLSQNEQGLQITEAGLSFLHALENSVEPAPQASAALGLEECSSMLVIEPGYAGDGHHQARWEEGCRVTTDINAEPTDDNPNDLSPYKGNSDVHLEQPPLAAPTFLQRGTGSRVEPPRRSLSARSYFLVFITQKSRSLINVWRRHVTQDRAIPMTKQPTWQIGSAAFSLLSLVAVLACFCAVIALGQIRSLKSDIAVLRRELLPLKAGLGKLELVERARRESAENTASNAGLKEGKSDEKANNAQATLNLSAEEIQLIRDYIKPVPSAGSSAPDIKVGDPVGSATIPLPSSLAEKVPQLSGARFTTRNGAIVISAKGSLRADVVLPRN